MVRIRMPKRLAQRISSVLKKRPKKESKALEEVEKDLQLAMDRFRGPNQMDSPKEYCSSLYEGPLGELRRKAVLYEHILSATGAAEVFESLDKKKQKIVNIHDRVGDLKIKIKNFIGSETMDRKAIADNMLALARAVYARLQEPMWKRLISNLENYIAILDSFESAKKKTSALADKYRIATPDTISYTENHETAFMQVNLLMSQEMKSNLAEISKLYTD